MGLLKELWWYKLGKNLCGGRMGWLYEGTECDYEGTGSDYEGTGWQKKERCAKKRILGIDLLRRISYFN